MSAAQDRNRAELARIDALRADLDQQRTRIVRRLTKHTEGQLARVLTIQQLIETLRPLCKNSLLPVYTDTGIPIHDLYAHRLSLGLVVTSATPSPLVAMVFLADLEAAVEHHREVEHWKGLDRHVTADKKIFAAEHHSDPGRGITGARTTTQRLILTTREID